MSVYYGSVKKWNVTSDKRKCEGNKIRKKKLASIEELLYRWSKRKKRGRKIFNNVHRRHSIQKKNIKFTDKTKYSLLRWSINRLAIDINNSFQVSDEKN